MAEAVTAQFVGRTSCGFVTGEILRDRGERRAGRVSVRAGGAGARVLPLFHAGKSEKQLARVGFA